MVCGDYSAGHPWVQVDGVAPDKPLDSAVLSRMKQFSAMNRLKKMALRVSLEDLEFYVVGVLKNKIPHELCHEVYLVRICPSAGDC